MVQNKQTYLGRARCEYKGQDCLFEFFLMSSPVSEGLASNWYEICFIGCNGTLEIGGDISSPLFKKAQELHRYYNENGEHRKDFEDLSSRELAIEQRKCSDAYYGVNR